jgi:hypothetical protein
MKLYTGVVENRYDPFKLGRCQVRVVGLHTHDKTQLKTEDLPWAYPLQPTTSAAMSGIGQSPLGPVEGTWVIVGFRDEENQQPIILGSIGGIPQDGESIKATTDQMILKEDGYLTKQDEQALTNSRGDVISNNSGAAALEDTGLATASTFTLSEEGRNLIEANGGTIDEDFLTETLKPFIDSNVKVDLTQGMYDSLVSFVNDNGIQALTDSSILKDLNNNDYLSAATGFAEFGKVDGQFDGAVLAKKLKEKDAFIAKGIPGPTGDLVPVVAAIPTVDTSLTATGQKDNGLKQAFGFRDPNGVYPLYKYEPDTNKLARHEDIKKTIVRKKELTRTKGIITATGYSWDQSPIPYNAAYPFNHVYQSESGHTFEFDDTKNSERINLYHKAGTFFEIDGNGTYVQKIVGDKYEILERDGHLYIKGSAHVTIDGNHNVKINNALNVEVMGNANIDVHGNMNTSVRGSYNLKAASVNIESYSGNINMLASGNISGDATRVDFNSGVSSATGLSTPSAYDPTMPSFKELQVITRGVEAAAHYETPEEGDASAYIAKRISEGTLDADDQDYGTITTSNAVARNEAVALPKSCTLIATMEKFTPDLYLSKHFTLGALTKNGARMPVAQHGMTAQEIVCNLKGLCENALEPFAEMYPGMVITSGFRRPGDVRGSSATSQHYLGQAADIVIPGFTRQQHLEAVTRLASIIPYDQVLLEYSGRSTVWIHVSFKYNANRYTAFTMRDHKQISSNGSFVLVA